MNEIIKINKSTIGGEELNSVNSRDIYEYLEVGAQYANWIQRAIEKYDFEEGIDFNIFVKPANNQKDYIVTIDMAKELCMVSNTENGKKVRKYFIKVEKQSSIPLTYEQVMQNALMMADEKVKALQGANELLVEKIDKKDEIILAAAELNIKSGDISIGDFSKNLAIPGLGRNKMYDHLRARGYLMMNNEPYQPYVERGYFKRKPYEESYGGEVKYKTIVTPRGSVWLTGILRAEFEIELSE